MFLFVFELIAVGAIIKLRKYCNRCCQYSVFIIVPSNIGNQISIYQSGYRAR